MTTQPNARGAVFECSWSNCKNNEARTRNPLKFAGVPQTRQPISAVSQPSLPYCEDLWRRHCCLTSFFFWLSIHALVAKIQPNKVVWWCTDGEFLHTVFSVSRVQHISHLHSKFALRSHHVWKHGRHPIYGHWEQARKKKKEKKKKLQQQNIMACRIGGHNEVNMH